ncbi:MAG: MAPEG family protein [Burkholderiaceae bacterium]
MTIAFWCVLAAGLMPYLATTIAKAGGERYNNRDPRAWLERQQGLRKRANNAQANAFEAFPFFAAAVIVASLTAAPQERVDALAVIFIVARTAYLVCYLADWHWARSVVWLIGWLATVTIFVSGVQ